MTFLGAGVAEAAVERPAPGGVTIDGATVRADGGEEQGPWAFAVDVERSGYAGGAGGPDSGPS